MRIVREITKIYEFVKFPLLFSTMPIFADIETAGSNDFSLIKDLYLIFFLYSIKKKSDIWIHIYLFKGRAKEDWRKMQKGDFTFEIITHDDDFIETLFSTLQKVFTIFMSKDFVAYKTNWQI